MQLALSQTRAILLGVATADALGVPVEFSSRTSLDADPIRDMRAFGTYNQPAGTWSDDSTMSFCLVEELAAGQLRLRRLANRFINWVDYGYWTPHGRLFDIGNTTRAAIERMRDIEVDVATVGGTHEGDNGNGSLMRILPLLAATRYRPLAYQIELVRQVSGMTHGHPRSVLCCLYYLWVAHALLDTSSVPAAMQWATSLAERAYELDETLAEQRSHLIRLTDGNIVSIPRANIQSTGYVVHTLEASLWCLLQTTNYRDAVLVAVNLGEDTDTTAAVTGGLAALAYGVEDIPTDWLTLLARRQDIEDLATRWATP